MIDMWYDRIISILIKGCGLAFGTWMGYRMFQEIRKAWKMDHKHRNYWSSEEYWDHVKEFHPDIWKEHMEGEEG